MKLKKLLMTAAAVIMIAGAAVAEFSNMGTITKTFDVQGQSTTISIDPQIALSGEDGLIKVAIKATVDASDLQDDLMKLMNRKWKNDECGQRFNTHGADIRPSGDQLFVGVTAQAQLWECIKTKFPKTYSKMKCIVSAFGKCRVTTKVPYIRWEMETIKTKLISQSVRTEAMITPIFKNGSIAADIHVTKAAPSGLAGELVSLFGLHGKIKDLVQSKGSESVAGKSSAFPAEIMAYDPKIDDIDFVDLGGGKLGIMVSATGEITQDQIVELLSAELN